MFLSELCELCRGRRASTTWRWSLVQQVVPQVRLPQVPLSTVVRLALALICAHALVCACLIAGASPPAGFFFLVLCLGLMVGLHLSILRRIASRGAQSLGAQPLGAQPSAPSPKLLQLHYRNVSKVKLF